MVSVSEYNKLPISSSSSIIVTYARRKHTLLDFYKNIYLIVFLMFGKCYFRDVVLMRTLSYFAFYDLPVE